MSFLALISRFLLVDTNDIENSLTDGNGGWAKDIVVPLVKILDALLIPAMIIVGVAGAIYAIVIGVQYSKAESTDKRDEAKKKLINGAIGIVVALIILIAMKLFIKYVPAVKDWINSVASE